MKLKTILEGTVKSEWQLNTRERVPELVLFSDHGSGKPLQYAAEFVKPHEDYIEYYAQKVKHFSDRIEWGGEHTQSKNFKSLSELNSFLKKQSLPNVTGEQLRKIFPEGICFIGVTGLGTSYLPVKVTSLESLRSTRETPEEFIKEVIAMLRKATKGWTIPANKLTKDSERCLKDFHKTGKWPEVN